MNQTVKTVLKIAAIVVAVAAVVCAVALVLSKVPAIKEKCPLKRRPKEFDDYADVDMDEDVDVEGCCCE